MKSNELMIGDWINLKRKNGEDCYYKVTSIRQRDKDNSENDYIDVKCGTVYGFCAEPIPITPEILKKNGFREIAYCWGEHKDFPFALEKLPGDSEWTVIILSRISSDIRLFNISYIHELQHLFNLCKTGKEIKL